MSHAVHSPLQDLGGAFRAEMSLGVLVPAYMLSFLPTKALQKCKEVSETGDSLIHLIYEKCESFADSSILLHLVMTHCG